MKRKAIVFGANGYLGRHVAHYLKLNNIEFLPTGSRERSIDGYDNYRQVDITDPDSLSQLDFNVNYVFQFAGLTGTQSSEELAAKFARVNVQGLKNIINCCENVTNLRLIFPSTRLVYKGVTNKPLSEDDVKEAKTIYAQTKLRCEELLSESRITHTIFRICVPYGNLFGQEYSYGTIGFFLSRAKSGRSITLYGDGSLKRTFTHVTDIIAIMLESIVLNATKNNIYNIGSNDDLSLLSVANLIASKFNVQIEHVKWPEEALKVESGDTIFSGHALQSLIHYQYQYSMASWIEDLN